MEQVEKKKALIFAITDCESNGRDYNKYPLIFKSWEAINSFIRNKSLTIKNKGCCLKTWFKVAFEDCFLYSGRHDILEPSREEANLRKHIREFCSFSSGRKKNPDLTERGYENHVNNFPAQKITCGILLDEYDI